jgi:hypothetical protein
LAKSDKITRRITNVYKSSTNESLLSILLKELIKSHTSTETKTVATQTDAGASSQQPAMDVSMISTKSRSKRSKKKRNHGILSQDFKAKKPKKMKELTAIAQNLEKMSSNINVITNKLDDFQRNPSQDESKAIIGHVGTIMSQLNGCISNFESLCHDIKQINETRNRNYDEWMDDLQNSENGRRFLKKLQKSFSLVVGEEKQKIEKDFRRKLDREKSKLSKRYQRSNIVEKKQNASSYPDDIAMEITEIFRNTCMMIKDVEKENKLFEKSLEIDAKTATMMKKKKALSGITKTHPTKGNLNLNDCRQIHSAESSSVKSEERYGSTSLEDDSDENN